jgi:hypothetical protein
LNFEPVDESSKITQHLQNLATDTAWLLEQTGLEFEQEALIKCYNDILQQRGLIATRGSAAALKVADAFKEHFSAQLLSILGHAINDRYVVGRWPVRLLRTKGKRIVAPAQHLLLMRFLGYEPAQFFALVRQTDVRQSDTFLGSISARPHGKKTVTAALSDSAANTGQEGAQTDKPFNCSDFTLLLASKREEWETLRRNNPHATRTQLNKKGPVLRRWLRRFDPAWLADNLPPSLRRGNCLPPVDWDARDVRIAREVLNSAILLKDQPGIPRRITKTAIGTTSGYHIDISYNSKKLPRTTAAVASVVETMEEYAIRRALWVVEHASGENTPSTLHTLARLAKIEHILKKPVTRKAVEDVFSRIAD